MNELRIVEEMWSPAAPSFPQDDYFDENWRYYHFAQFASTLGLSPMLGDGMPYGEGVSVWRLGDSNVTVAVTWTQLEGEAGMDQFADYCRDLADAMALALESMSDDYAEIYAHMLDDIAENGVNMPFHEGLVEPYDPRLI